MYLILTLLIIFIYNISAFGERPRWIDRTIKEIQISENTLIKIENIGERMNLVVKPSNNKYLIIIATKIIYSSKRKKSYSFFELMNPAIEQLEMEDKTKVVKVNMKSLYIDNIFRMQEFDNNDFWEIRYEIFVPSSCGLEISSTQGNIDIDISGINATAMPAIKLVNISGKALIQNIIGDVVIDADNTKIKAYNLDGAIRFSISKGELYIGGIYGNIIGKSTGTTKIEISDAIGDNTRIDSASGTVILRRIGGNKVRVTTSSANVTIETSTKPAEIYDISTTDGNIECSLSTYSFRIETKTRGKVNCYLKDCNENLSRAGYFSQGNEETKINLHSNTGNIKINQQ